MPLHPHPRTEPEIFEKEEEEASSVRAGHLVVTQVPGNLYARRGAYIMTTIASDSRRSVLELFRSIEPARGSVRIFTDEQMCHALARELRVCGGSDELVI